LPVSGAKRVVAVSLTVFGFRRFPDIFRSLADRVILSIFQVSEKRVY